MTQNTKAKATTTATPAPVPLRGGMSEQSLSLLRHLEAHGPQTRDEIAKTYRQLQRPVLLKCINQLVFLGHLANDTSTKDPRVILLSKGRARLAQGTVRRTPTPHSATQAKKLPSTRALRLARIALGTEVVRPAQINIKEAPTYKPAEFAPSNRAGAMVAFGLPSRWGEQLRWPDGRVTLLDRVTPWPGTSTGVQP